MPDSFEEHMKKERAKAAAIAKKKAALARRKKMVAQRDGMRARRKAHAGKKKKKPVLVKPPTPKRNLPQAAPMTKTKSGKTIKSAKAPAPVKKSNPLLKKILEAK